MRIETNATIHDGRNTLNGDVWLIAGRTWANIDEERIEVIDRNGHWVVA